MKKLLVSLSVLVLGVTGIMHVAIADPVDKETVCVVSAGQGHPNVEVTVGEPATDAPAFAPSCPSESGGGGGYTGGFGGFRVSAADVADELAETP